MVKVDISRKMYSDDCKTIDYMNFLLGLNQYQDRFLSQDRNKCCMCDKSSVRTFNRYINEDYRIRLSSDLLDFISKMDNPWKVKLNLSTYEVAFRKHTKEYSDLQKKLHDFCTIYQTSGCIITQFDMVSNLLSEDTILARNSDIVYIIYDNNQDILFEQFLKHFQL